jgi:hypothetical protein
MTLAVGAWIAAALGDVVGWALDGVLGDPTPQPARIAIAATPTAVR